MGNETSIGLFLGFARETAHFELCVEMHGAAVGMGAQFGGARQRAKRFENFYERLRRFQSPRIQFDDLRRTTRRVATAHLRRRRLAFGSFSAGLPREEHFPVASGNDVSSMLETLTAQKFTQRHGFERRDQAESFIRPQIGRGLHNFGKRFAPRVNVFAHIERNDLRVHKFGPVNFKK